MLVSSDRGLFFMIEYYIFYNKMIVVNCTVEKNIPIEVSINTDTDVNCISQKYISELGITYHDKSNGIEAPDPSYSTLEKVDLHISFNDGEKHKSTPGEFIVVGSDWPGPDLILGGSWFRESDATLN